MSKTFETKSIDDADDAELREYASAFLGLPVAGDSPAEVLSKVRAANDGDTIYVRIAQDDPLLKGTAPMPVDGPGGGLEGGLGHNDPKVTLTLHSEERDGVVVSRHKEVGVNGKVWLLKRGESITIPLRVFMALDNADRDIVTHDSNGEVLKQKVKNTPFNIEKMPSDAEIASWRARTDNQFAPA